MSGYEQRLAADKNEIRQRIGTIGDRVQRAVLEAVEALLARDEAACSRIMIGDLPINREVRAIDKLCHAFVARHLPSAGHLRFVSSVLQMNVALERVGDYAVTIAREGLQLRSAPPERLAEELLKFSRQSCEQLERATLAFTQRDADLARATKPRTREIGQQYSHIFRRLVENEGKLPTADLFAVLTVFHRVERVSDQAKNLCEETLFEVLGETKPPKRYSIHFVDARSTLVAPLAAALGSKAFPESGKFTCSGFQPGTSLAPELQSVAVDLGLDLTGIAPTALETGRDQLGQHHVIVCLSGEARKHIAELPYATALFVWELPAWSEGPAETLGLRLKELAQFLGLQLRELMVTMRGEDAS